MSDQQAVRAARLKTRYLKGETSREDTIEAMILECFMLRSEAIEYLID
jgi:hypothetical protein